MDDDYLDGLNGLGTNNSMSNIQGLLQRELDERQKKQNEEFAANHLKNVKTSTSDTPQPATPVVNYSSSQSSTSKPTNTSKTESKQPPKEYTEQELEEIGQGVLGLLWLAAIVFVCASFLVPGFISYMALQHLFSFGDLSGWIVFFFSLVTSVAYYFIGVFLLDKYFHSLDEDKKTYLPLLPHVVVAIPYWYFVFAS